MVEFMRGSGSRTKSRVEVRIFIQTETFMLEIFITVKSMVRDNFNGQVVRGTMGNGWMERNMDQVFGKRWKGIVTSVSGNWDNLMDTGFTDGWMEIDTKVNSFMGSNMDKE